MMTVRPSQGMIVKASSTHQSLLIEPVLLPSLEHIHVDVSNTTSDNCLFYPNGHKNRNMRKEIENTVKRHDEIPREVKKRKSKYRVIPADPYEHIKSSPLQHSRKLRNETIDIIKSMRDTESKMQATTQIRL